VWRAQRTAVADGLRYLEAEAGWGRFGAGGTAGWFQGDGLLGAAFEHRTSRPGTRTSTRTCWWPIRCAGRMGR